MLLSYSVLLLHNSNRTATTGLNLYFVLSGNTEKAKMAWNQEGKECVNERTRQREKGTKCYKVGKKKKDMEIKML